ncbi:mediator of RNA polymerase II transcription subunit 15a-like isoform X2 [Momordica charantia]|uniref:Mediator of RNA polymerase II transcription subunit 15a-like isoform X2 n=2 Tax=Momordica charantia TaxID=3673 RepID=A0A6J1D3G7_MOMCH|nr:mediator of RNA polymerase II transcription subunit 15a-like isoform X2 [Momordica charantia]
MKFEEEMFNKANSKDHYIYNISRKMSRIENRHEGSSSIQDHPAFSSDKSVVQKKKEAVFVSQPLPQMTNQPYPRPMVHNQRQQLAAPNPLLRQNIMQLTPQSHEQLQRQNLNARQLHQQFGMHSQSCVRPQNTLISPCRPLGLQSRDSGVYIPPQMFPPHSEVMNLQPNENLRAQIKEEVIGEDVQASKFVQPHHTPRGPNTMIEQHKQHQSMGVSAVLIENPKGEDWHDQAYNEMQGLKMTCLPLLKESYERAAKLCLEVGQTEQIQKCKNHMSLMQKMTNFLELPRDKITYFTKEKFYQSMKSIEKFAKAHENRNTFLVNKQQPLHGQPGISQSHINPVQRSDNANPHFQPLNLAATGSSDSSSPRTPSEIGSSRPEANRIQKNLLQKRQQPEIIKQEFQSSWIQQMQKSTESIQAINRSGVSLQNHLNSKHSPQSHEEASQLSKIAERALSKDPCSSVYGRDGRASPTPSSSTVGLGKSSSNVSCLSSLNFQYPETRNSVNLLNSKTKIQVKSHEIRSSGISTSQFAEPTSLGSSQHLSTATQPLNRLLKAVDSMSDQALRTAISGISSVGNMCDTVTEPSVFGTRCHQKAAHLSLQDGFGSSNNMKRKICAITLNDMPSPCSDNDGSELTVTSRSKKLKKLTDNALLEEMRNINQRLVETVLELDSAQNVNRRFANAGTVVRCTYSAVSDRNNLMFHFANTLKLPVLSVKLLVPLDYPEDYPVFLSKFNTDCGNEDEECRDLSRKATSMLRAFLRTAPERLSLGEYARAWDQCARYVVSEYAQRTGGGCFSSRYGTWEDCVAAT